MGYFLLSAYSFKELSSFVLTSFFLDMLKELDDELYLDLLQQDGTKDGTVKGMLTMRHI